MKIVHCISSLAVGGAETALFRFAKYDSTCQHEVITLMPEAHYDAELRHHGVAVTNIGIKRGGISVKGFRQLSSALSAAQSDVIMSWMYHSNLACVMHKMFDRSSANLVWNIRHSLDSINHDSRKTRTLIKLSALFSKRANAVVYNSGHAQKQHQALGYSDRHSHVVHNGLASSSDVVSLIKKSELCMQIGIDGNPLLIGAAGRYHLIKGHDVLLDAFARATNARSDIHLVLCGSDVVPENTKLSEQIKRLNLSGRVHLMGSRTDLRENIYPALDVFCSPSRSEGFPNVVAEAMNAGLPTIVTDTGESAYLVGETGLVCAPNDSTALAEAFLEFFEKTPEERAMLGQAGRMRVHSQFSLDAMCSKYHAIFGELI